MNNLGFWLVAGALTLGVMLLLILAQRRAPGARPAGAPVDVQVYRDQLAEVDRDLARGTLANEEAQRLRAEIARRLLEADRQAALNAPATARQGGRGSLLVSAALVLAAGAGAVALYSRLGVPWYPDMPLERRLATLDATMADRPSQAEELARLARQPDAATLAPLEAELAAATDPEALLESFRSRYAAGEMRAAILTIQRRIALLGETATAGDHLALAIALVNELDGYVSPEAEAALRETLRRDLGNEVARYLVGEMFVQGGRYDLAFRFWRPLLEQSAPDAPWVTPIRERIETVARLAGERYTMPPLAAAAGSGPGAEDMAAAAELTEEERQEMIGAMVEQLADRLATEGGSAEEWAQLITALGVLGRIDEAREVYAEAQAIFEGHSVDLQGLREAAVMAGAAE